MTFGWRNPCCMLEDIPEGSKPVLIRGGFFASAAEEGLQTFIAFYSSEIIITSITIHLNVRFLRLWPL